MDAESRTVFVIDDEKAIRDSLTDVLGFLGYNVMTAGNGIDALQLFTDHAATIDIVLLDANVRGMSSTEILRGLLRIRSAVPVVVLSGFSEAQIAERYQLEGYKAYLRKPYSIDELMSLLESNW